MSRFTQYSVLSTRYLDFIWLLMLAAYILAGTFAVPFHGDEATQIYMSRDYAYQFLQGDLDRVRYHEPPINATEQELRLLNGTLNKYMIGLAWHLGGFSVDQINEQWDWGADWSYNQQNHHAPSEALLHVSRIPSALLLAVGVVMMFALGRALGGRPVAYLASLYYVLNPALLINGRRAMMEGSLIALALLVVLAGVWMLQNRRWWLVLLFGLAAGLALASKHTAVFTVVAVFGVCAAYPVIRWVAGRRQPANEGGFPLRLYGWLLVSGILALAVFYALNPAWWGDPAARAGQVLALRNDLLAGQTAAFGGYATISDALVGFFRQVFVNLPQYYEIPAWASYIAEPIARYESSAWRGASLGGSVVGGIVLLTLTMIGGWTLLHRKLTGTRWVVGMWALAMLAATALLTPLEWQRYYLPVYPAIGLLAAAGLVTLVGRFRIAWRLPE